MLVSFLAGYTEAQDRRADRALSRNHYQREMSNGYTARRCLALIDMDDLKLA